VKKEKVRKKDWKLKKTNIASSTGTAQLHRLVGLCPPRRGWRLERDERRNAQNAAAKIFRTVYCSADFEPTAAAEMWGVAQPGQAKPLTPTCLQTSQA
jgi:hypothetical protein